MIGTNACRLAKQTVSVLLPRAELAEINLTHRKTAYKVVQISFAFMRDISKAFRQQNTAL